MASYIKSFEDFVHNKETSAIVSEVVAEEEQTLPESVIPATGCGNKMEHSYTRDTTRPSGALTTGLSPARTILVRRPPQCPACHSHPLEEHDLEDHNQVAVPTYNEIAAKEAMNECARIAKYVKNVNADDEDWEARINQFGWTNIQKTFFSKVVRILDNDQLGRLANAGRQNEPMQRRVVVDKSAARMRKTLASVAWDSRLTQWIHSLLMDNLPSTYMASYLDILQTLKTKLPTLMDKMLFGRPLNVSQELLAPVMKKQWEPMVNTKQHKLAQNAVIVALPSVPTSGPIPNRLQKWYQQLATITQIVQVTLPMTSGHITRQPLEMVAEQIVSLTRVKVQELRSENPTRSIILIGFNVGAALALQVAMSENIACVVCMGFAYNTFNGVRGVPDDRILDIKMPILFVIGQNSARSSPEEIESLREKMQSETSLVIVGSADDMLRVPKSRRKIENVTQSMVDAMVVDEVYEFIKKTLTHPPGPRIPTSITSGAYGKNKNAVGGSGDGTTGKSTPVHRKRKQDGNDPDQTPAKTKYVPHIGRPRTRPLVSVTPAKTSQISTTSMTNAKGGGQQAAQISSTSISNEVLGESMQFVLDDSNEHEMSLNTGNVDTSPKMVTNFEIMATSKSAPIKTTVINPVQKSVGGTSNITTKIKMIPSSQFVPLKPPLQSQSKIYTIKPASVLNQSQSSPSGGVNIGNIVTTSSGVVGTGQQQIFTLKSPNGQTTQYVTAAPATAQQKYTVVKNANGGTTLQLTTSQTTPAKSIGGVGGVGGLNVDLSNINDMPIIFADNDGNLSDSMAAGSGGGGGGGGLQQQGTTINKPSTSSGVGQLIISQKIIKEAGSGNITTSPSPPKGGTYVINKPTTLIQQPQQINKPNKVVFINRNTMKPCPNIISRSNVAQQLPKYTKVVVTNPKTSASTLVPRPGTQITSTNISGSPIVSSVKQVNLQPIKSPVSVSARPSGILNVSTKSLPQIQIINSPGNVSATSILSDKPQIRNIVVKPGGLKPITPNLKTQFLNRNLTVRKLVNILPPSKGGVITGTSKNASVTIVPSAGPLSTVTPTTSQSSSGQDGVQPISTSSTVTVTTMGGVVVGAGTTSSNSGSSSIQTSPKIITLNPINPSVSGSATATAVATTTVAQPKAE